jgi:Tfp pilus assembly protein PilO
VKPFWRRRLLVPALVLLALNVVTYLAFTLPRSKAERNIAERTVVVREEVAQERARVEGIRERARTIAANTADVTRFYDSLGRKESLLTVQEAIAGIARQLGLTVGSRSYSNDTVTGSDSLARFRITMPIAGSYPQIASFLQRLEALPHFVTVDSISLREESGGAAAHSTNLSVVLSIYFVDTEPGDGA